jgi:hypothetical protein
VKRLLFSILLLGMIGRAHAADAPPELKAIEARYDQRHFAHDDSLREKYLNELAKLHWYLVDHSLPGIDAVNAEINRHPVPPTADTKALTKARLGLWHSPRHDYLFRADGTWIMDPSDDDPSSTHGTWAIHGNQYFETTATTPETRSAYVIILLDKNTFIFTEPGSPDSSDAYYEQRPAKGGLPF